MARLDLRGLSRRYVVWLEANHYSAHTVRMRKGQLGRFVTWCADRAIVRPSQVSRELVESYQRHLFRHRRENGQPLAKSSQAKLLEAVRSLFSWSVSRGHLSSNPTEVVQLPKVTRRLPQKVLTPLEVQSVLDAIDVSQPLGLRDRAMVCLLYSTGMRRAELCGLSLLDLDETRETLLIRHGKGGRQRTVPVGAVALHWVLRYVDEVRGRFVRGSKEGALFVSRRGAPLSPGHVTNLVKQRLAAVDLDRPGGGPHLLRHAVATSMLENGADVRVVQELLGHQRLSSTEVYTHVTITNLKAVHTATHPAGKIDGSYEER